jgi:hypothetical protein
MVRQSANHGISRVYGVDFSGAEDAGKHIWITEGIVEGNRLRVEKCYPARQLPGADAKRQTSMTALRNLIANADSVAFGMDFPFGLPSDLVVSASWTDFVRTFAARFPTAEAFHLMSHAASAGSEKRRRTDDEARTPMSAYNLRLYRQTYFGIRDVLGPLIGNGRTCVLPMCGPPKPGHVWLLEICPTSTRKLLGLHGATPKIVLSTPTYDFVLENSEKRGDPIDSLLAAEATFRAIRNPSLHDRPSSPYDVEGKVYV